MWEELIFYVCSCQLSSLFSIHSFFSLNANQSDLFLPDQHNLPSSFLAASCLKWSLVLPAAFSQSSAAAWKIFRESWISIRKLICLEINFLHQVILSQMCSQMWYCARMALNGWWCRLGRQKNAVVVPLSSSAAQSSELLPSLYPIH